MKLRETRCVYDTEGPEGGARGGTSEGKEQDRGGRAKRASERGKARPKRRRRGEGGKLQVYMLEHASHTTRIVNSCGRSMYLASQGYIKSTLRQG